MSNANDFKDSSISKRIASNIPRAGLLVIPYVGPAIEKAIFGPLDDKAMDEARRQIHDALEELSVDIRFAQADLKDEIVMLAENIRATSVELAEKIERLDPVIIENFIVQNIKPTIINVFVKIDPEEVRSLSGIAGMLPGEISADKTAEAVGEILFDGAVKQGSLSKLIAKLTENHPSLLAQFSEGLSSSDIENLKARFTDASHSLLKWPTTLGNKIWLHRGELDLLEERITSTEGRASLILGKPGTGKSAILALLSQRLIKKDIPVLAIKADMLPKSVENLDALQTFLHLPFPVIKCLSIVSRDNPVVLIIDQLDAISEFVDRNSERLNLLLDLIQIASTIDGVHVVSSCRWFEYQHDIRLTTIEAERMSLNPPRWEDVQRVLKNARFTEDHWSAEAQSLLSVPLHLKILLDIKSRDSEAKVPSSLQGLLEDIWQQRVISGENGPMKLDFIDILCKMMSEEEELWVPRSLADKHVDLLEELQQVNIIQLGPLGLKIGFVHQTYFDFARARAFARGQERLSEYVIKRQDGLFIRPVLLSTLDYLRGASHAAYKREVKSLWGNKDLRPHLRNLIIEYLGGTDKPNDTEISCLLPMFENEKLRFKVTLAMAGSPGWFYLIKDKYIPSFMAQGPELAHFIIPLMSRAFSFSKDEVYRLIKDKWLPNGEYDENILVLFTYMTDWDETSVDIICKVANRHQSHWIPHIADLVSQTMPELAPKIVRADFDRRLKEAIKKEDDIIQPPPPSPDASDEEKIN